MRTEGDEDEEGWKKGLVLCGRMKKYSMTRNRGVGSRDYVSYK